MAPAHQYGDCPVSMLGMTPVKSQKQTLLDKIDDMTPVGTTNQSIGTVLGLADAEDERSVHRHRRRASTTPTWTSSSC